MHTEGKLFFLLDTILAGVSLHFTIKCYFAGLFRETAYSRKQRAF